MSAEDDDDDAQLKQLRSVWISMREEEPPEKGLAALMAAAREKADEMKADEVKQPAAEPGWWSKLLASLRRPPMLALASVLVLVGGAALLANRDKDIASSNVGVAPEAPMQTAPNVEGTAREELPPAPQAELMGSLEKQIMKPRPPVKPEVEKAKDDTAKAPGGGEATPLMTPKPPPADNDAPRETKRSPTRGPVKRQAVDDFERDDVAGATGEAAPEAQTAKVAATQRGAEPTVAQLYAQCEKAAANQDCETVRQLAAKIMKTDAAYRERIIRNTSITRCIDVGGPAE